MPVVTVQLGQCGNQLGCSFFQALSGELSTGEYGRQSVEEYFRPLQGPHGPPAPAGGRDAHVARAVMIDMEPKVVHAARATAADSGGWWRYSPRGFLCMQSGAGNNWAHGFHGYGPRVHEEALNLVRREVEACDLLGGFVLLQSMAGGTGAGLGTYVAQALRDEYQSSNIVNCCVWPYESGEVIVQSYNTLLTLSHLSDLSDGIVLMSNEALHRLSNKLFNIPRPSFSDMNSIAARALANMLLPSNHRAAAAAGRPSTASLHGRGSEGGAAGSSTPGASYTTAGGTDRRLPPARQRSSSQGDGYGAGAGSFAAAGSMGSPLAQHAQQVSTSPVRLLPDVVSHLCCHPHHRLLTLRSIPQMPATSADFTTFTWTAMLKRLRQMLLTGGIMEEGMDWGVSVSSPQGGRGAGSHASTRINKSLANWLVLRGQAADEVDVSDFADPALYPAWAVDPLMVSSSGQRFNKYTMAAAMLSNDQATVGPVQRMQERASTMLAARAFIHQYEKFGLGAEDFRACFAHVEDIVERYKNL